VQINAEGSFTRRCALFDELPDGAEPLLQRFVVARLLVTSQYKQKRQTIEVTHEALLRTWPQLGEWLVEDRDKLRLLERLQRAAEDWHQGNRGDDLLIHRDGGLKEISDLVAIERFKLAEVCIERVYLSACESAQKKREALDRAIELDKVQAAERLAAERKRKMQASFAGMAAAFVIAGLAGWQYWQAERETQRANAGRLSIAADREKDQHIDLSLLLANEAVEATISEPKELNKRLAWWIGKAVGVASAPTVEAQSALLSALVTHAYLKKVFHGAIGLITGPNGKRLALSSLGNTVRFWDLENRPPAGAQFKPDRPVKRFVVSPDGKRFALVSDDQTVRVWSTEDGKFFSGVPTNDRIVKNIAFSSDGKVLMLMSEWDSKLAVYLWDTTEKGSAIRMEKEPIRLISVALEH
jgi:hypothetical protein